VRHRRANAAGLDCGIGLHRRPNMLICVVIRGQAGHDGWVYVAVLGCTSPSNLS